VTWQTQAIYRPERRDKNGYSGPVTAFVVVPDADETANLHRHNNRDEEDERRPRVVQVRGAVPAPVNHAPTWRT